MKIREINNQLIQQIENLSDENKEWDSDELTALCKRTLKKEFNSVCVWDECFPNKATPHSIVNTDN